MTWERRREPVGWEQYICMQHSGQGSHSLVDHHVLQYPTLTTAYDGVPPRADYIRQISETGKTDGAVRDSVLNGSVLETFHYGAARRLS